MARFLVQKTLTRNSVEKSFPGQVIELSEVEDARELALLHERGFIVPVPDSFVGKANPVTGEPGPAVSAEDKAKAEERANAEADAPSREDRIADLSRLNRSDLNDIGKREGLEDADKYPNKAALVEAIVDHQMAVESGADAIDPNPENPETPTDEELAATGAVEAVNAALEPEVGAGSGVTAAEASDEGIDAEEQARLESLEEELAPKFAAMSDEEVDAALEVYSIEANDGSRQAKEAALLGYAVEHPDEFKDD